MNLAFGILGLILATATTSSAEQPHVLITGATTLAYAAFLVIAFFYAVRRLHDLNRSGWMSLLFVIPLINLFFMLYLVFWPGSDIANDYGPPPSKNTALLWIAAVLLPLITIAGIIAAVAIPGYQDFSTSIEEAQSSE